MDVRRSACESVQPGRLAQARLRLPAAALTLSLTALMLVAPAAPAAVAGKAFHRGELTVTPSTVVAGGSLLLSGADVPARRLVAVSVDGGHRSYARADRRGRWMMRLRVPRRARGQLRLHVRVGGQPLFDLRLPVVKSAGVQTSLAGLVSGEYVNLSTTRVAAGSVVQLIGAGFRGHDLAGVWLGNRRLARPRPGPGGSLRATVRIPARTPPRTYVLSLHYHGNLNFNLTVAQPSSSSGAGGPTPSSQPAPPPSPTSSTPTSPTPPPPPPPPANVVVDAVADMSCDPSDPNYNNGLGNPFVPSGQNNCLGKYVSDLIVGNMPNALLEIGDVQQDPSQSLQSYQQAFDPTFGRANAVAFPEVGNAEYGNEWNGGTAVPPTAFFDYFQNARVFSHIAAMPGSDTSHLNVNDMYYSFNLGAWHIIALNSNCSDNSTPANVGNCGAGGPEETWLKQDLANYRQSNPTGCILAYWHHPLFAPSASDPASQAWWQDLYNAHATLVLNGHGGNSYQRYAPQDPNGNPDPNGIREFVVSMGGLSHTTPPTGHPPTLQTSNYNTFGILQLTLHPGSYDWKFIPATNDGENTTFSDSGTASCAQ